MIWKRPKRRTLWLAGGAVAILILALVPMTDRASGPFKVRPVIRAEVRAPVVGFLEAVYCDEGSAKGQKYRAK